jgi:hypothetical protein
MIDFHRFEKISPTWWAAVASGLAAGAVLVPAHRVIGGLVAGGALLALAYTQTPCCDACGAAGVDTTAPSRTAAVGVTDIAPPMFGALMRSSPGYYSGGMSPTDAHSGCTTCLS